MGKWTDCHAGHNRDVDSGILCWLLVVPARGCTNKRYFGVKKRFIERMMIKWNKWYLFYLQLLTVKYWRPLIPIRVQKDNSPMRHSEVRVHIRDLYHGTRVGMRGHYRSVYELGIDALITLPSHPMTLDYAMENAADLTRDAVERGLRILRLGSRIAFLP